MGYKQTEVGVIPDDWEVTTLREVAQIRSGIAKNANVSVANPVLVNYLRVANVQDGFLDLSEMSQLEVSRSELQRFSVLPGDVLMNEGGDLDKLGRGSIWRGEFQPCVHQNHVFVVRAGESVAPDYLATWSAGSIARRYFIVAGIQTTNLASINKTALGKLPVVLPPKQEQGAIVEAVRDLDELVAELERLITKKRDLKQAVMQQLLTGQTRLPGFSGEWREVRLGDLGAFLRGAGVKKDEAQSGELSCVRYGEIYTHHHDHIRSFTSWISRDVARGATRLHSGDLLFAASGETKKEIGKCVAFVSSEEAYAGGDIVILRPGAVDSMFLGYLLNTPAVAAQKASYGQGDAVVHISAAALARVQLSIPALKEQVAIAAVLRDIDVEIQAVERRREKSRNLKQAMMQELLTGRTRLV